LKKKRLEKQAEIIDAVDSKFAGAGISSKDVITAHDFKATTDSKSKLDIRSSRIQQKEDERKSIVTAINVQQQSQQQAQQMAALQNTMALHMMEKLLTPPTPKDYRLDQLERDVGDLKEGMKQILEAINRTSDNLNLNQ